MKSNKKKPSEEKPNQAGQRPDPNEWILKLERAERQAGIGSWEFDVTTGQGWWSGQMHAFFGSDVTKGTPDVETYLSYLHPDDQHILQATLDAMARGTEPEKRDFRTNPERGPMRVLSPNYRLEKDEDGRPLRFSGTLQDITAHVQAEETLRKNEERFRTTFDSMLEGTQIIGFDWRYVYLNAAAERHNRRASSELLGNVYMEMWPGIESTHVFFVIKRCMEERIPAHLENEFVFPDGAIGWFELSIQPVPEGVFILSIDVSERKRAERKLAQMTRLYATLSQINQTIIRVKEREELFRSICHAAATFGGVSLVWVGLLDESTGDVQPVAANSLDVSKWPFPIANIHSGSFVNGLIATAVRTSRVGVTENLQSDARMQSIKGLFEEHGYFATAVIPFRLRGRTIGILSLISHEAGLFKTEEEARLLEEMGLDISFALDKIADDEERRQAEENLRQSEENFSKAFSSSPVALMITRRADGTYREVNTAYTDLVGYERAELLGQQTTEFNIFLYLEQRQEIMSQLLANGRLYNYEAQIRHKSGEILTVIASLELIQFNGEDAILTTLVDISARKQAEKALKHNERILRLFVEHSPAAIAMLDRDMNYIVASRRYLADYNLPGQDLTGRSYYEVFPEVPERWKEVHRRCLAGAIEKAVEDPFPRADGSLDWVHWEIHPWYEEEEKIGGIILFSEVITERKHAESQLLLQSTALEAAANSIVITDQDGIIQWANPALTGLTGFPLAEVIGKNFRELIRSGKQNRDFYKTMWDTILAGRVWQGELINRRKDGTFYTEEMTLTPFRDKAGDIAYFIAIKQDVTERKQAEVNIRTQLKRITALNKIDRAINSILDMRMSLDILLNEVLSQLGVDAAAILLLDSAEQSLEFIAGKGFRTQAIRKSNMDLGQGLAGKVGQERKVMHIQNLAELGNQFRRANLLKGEEFVEYFGVPLIAKGMLKGVLEIFNRTSLVTDKDWIHYMETLGGQAAIAIDNAQLFQGVQQSNAELVIAYDATIAGWSRAMDLRDKETEGHTQRVTELTLRLAGKMGISQRELVQIRRGALLHDIGKLGVPDNILLKPGKLTEGEWDIMRQHPTHALEMLQPIHYLRSALDIPYCHHEKWDGTGYPRGLRGEQIPLAARIFAVVDVWDALRSDRPYREGWSAEKVREYIIKQSGKHFEPKVVQAFLRTLDDAHDS